MVVYLFMVKSFLLHKTFSWINSSYFKRDWLLLPMNRSKGEVHSFSSIRKQIGRTTNKWVSPRGCLMFSFKLQLSNPNYVCFVQYIISLCIVRGIKQIPECKDVDIGIKWPNDIYINKKLKIGGILCQSIYAGTFDITVGI